MARSRTTTATRKPSLMDRLRGRPAAQPAKVTTKRSKNPITGTQKVTQTTETHPHGYGHHGHGGQGPMASGTRTRAPRAQPVHHQRRKPSMGDKLSGALTKMKGSATHKPGVKVIFTRDECWFFADELVGRWNSTNAWYGRQGCASRILSALLSQ